MSSFAATELSELTLDPLYTASSVSKELPAVSNATAPLAGAVQRYQIERPPVLPACFGSPLCLLAPTVVPAAVPNAPASDCAAEKLSFPGAPLAAAASDQASAIVPVAPLPPSTAMRYVVPEVALNETLLCLLDAETSSLLATDASPLTAVP